MSEEQKETLKLVQKNIEEGEGASAAGGGFAVKEGETYEDSDGQLVTDVIAMEKKTPVCIVHPDGDVSIYDLNHLKKIEHELTLSLMFNLL